RTRQTVAYVCVNVTELSTQANLCADPVAIASRTDEPQDEPAVHIGAGVLPKFRPLAERAHDHVDFSSVVKIRKGAAAVCARKIKACFRGNIAERSVPEVGVETVGLFVVRESKKIY